LVRSSTIGMIFRAKMMSLAACATRSLSFIVDIGSSASKRAVRAAISALGVQPSRMRHAGVNGASRAGSHVEARVTKG